MWTRNCSRCRIVSTATHFRRQFHCSIQAASAAAAELDPSAGVPASFWTDLELASQWKTTKSDWDPQSCRKVVETYDQYLRFIVKDQQASSSETTRRLVSAETVSVAFKALLKCRFDSPLDLSRTVRKWESYLGILGQTQLTDHLSLRLLTANAKAGNLGRCLSLLDLRKEKKYAIRKREIDFAIRSIQIAAASSTAQRSIGASTHQQESLSSQLPFAQLRIKNIFVSDRDQPATDNPTRWLDAILIHMKQRDFPLTTALANRMLQCYSGTGRTGKAVHHFYQVQRTMADTTASTTEGSSSTTTAVDGQDNSLPRERLYDRSTKKHVVVPTKVSLRYRSPPPFFKVPSQAKNRHLQVGGSTKTRADRESESEFSAPLAATFAFAHSLQLGACGHAPVTFDVHSYNALIKASVYRGALWRAMHVLDTMIPNARDANGNPLQPNNLSYNLILSGLARVGDVTAAQTYYQKMLMQSKLQPDSFTVRAIVEGLLNLSDTPGAITATQDFFNQHNVLPPISTHCKLLEVCLATGMVYEAKRYVYFLQQLWRWEPTIYHSPAVVHRLRAVQTHPQLQKEALQELFAYFGERLDESDFL